MKPHRPSLKTCRRRPRTGAASRPPTPFELRVYECLRQVPSGSVTTYGALARALGIRSARAVGQALRRNPWAPDVPCHRVVGSDGRLVGYGGDDSRAALRRKAAMLRREGVRLEGDRVIGPYWTWSSPDARAVCARGSRDGSG